MLTAEQGPWNVFVRLRDKMGFVHDEFGHVIGRPNNNVLSCLWCTSVWVALIMMWMPLVVTVPLAISAMSIIIHEKLVSS